MFEQQLVVECGRYMYHRLVTLLRGTRPCLVNSEELRPPRSRHARRARRLTLGYSTVAPAPGLASHSWLQYCCSGAGLGVSLLVTVLLFRRRARRLTLGYSTVVPAQG
ncbi:hypothetical protein RRG08_058617 [Elysia crispata]|uniref:Uncharacterized protein n=1 Tax=Elysia crispata TaxID=231223 RepID=A0AAE1D7S6_9GAST|nr:hypothetical protein RRG08_058617 [Elysia crispata]